MSQDAVEIMLPAAIEYVARIYCAADTKSEDFEDMQLEAYEFIKTHFASLSIQEIKAAFSFAAAGIINADIKAYYGRFSLVLLGNVLKAYSEYRKLSLMKLSAGSNTKKHIDLEATQLLRIERLTNLVQDMNEREAIERVSTSDYQYLVERGLLVISDDDLKELETIATQYYKDELNKQVAIADKFSKKSLLDAIENPNKNKLQVRIERLAVVRYLQKSSNPVQQPQIVSLREKMLNEINDISNSL